MTEKRATREESQRKKVWTPPAALRTPEPPPGFVYKWVRARLLNVDDDENVVKHRREGYEIVRPEDLKDKDFIHASLEYNTDKGRDGTVRVGDVILMVLDEDIAKQRNDYYVHQAKVQQAAIDNELRQFQSRDMPVLPNESYTRPQVGRSVNFES